MDRKIENAVLALLEGRGEELGLETAGSAAPKSGTKKTKGDKRIILTCDEIETAVFGSRQDPQKIYGRKRNRASRAIGTGKGSEWRSVDMESSEDGTDDLSASADDDPPIAQSMPDAPDSAGDMIALKSARIRPPQTDSEVNGSIGGEKGWAERKGETEQDLARRQEGMRRAEEREMVRRAARRAVVFGFRVASNDEEQANEGGGSGRKGKKAHPKEGDLENKLESMRKCEALMNGSVVEPSFAKGNWAIRWREL